MVTSDNGQNQQAVTSDLSALEALVQQSLTQVRGVYEILPDLQSTPIEGRSLLRFAGTVSDEFLEACVVASEHDPTMQAKTGLDPARTRLVIARNLRFESLAAAVETLARDVRYNMALERWDVVQQALQTYDLAKGFTRNARAASLVAHVKTMQSALGRTGRPRKAKGDPAPAPKV